MKQPYNIRRDYTIEEGCPWYEAQQAFGPPNLNLCEKSSCSYFDEPANTWSNLAVILVGVILIQKIKEPLVQNFAISVIILGIVSFIYHSTNNLLTQYIDFLGMYLVASFLVAFNLARALGKNPRKIYPLIWFVFSLHAIALSLIGVLQIPIQYTVLISALPVFTFDLMAGYREGRLLEYKYFLFALITITIAQSFAIMDAQKIYCEPENLLLHGHVLWHLISAVSMLFQGLHMNRMLKKT